MGYSRWIQQMGYSRWDTADGIQQVGYSSRKPEYELDDDVVIGTAAGRGDLEKVANLLRNGTKPSPRYRDGFTPLLMAAESGKQDIVSLLLAHGASVTEQDRFGRTALHHAVLNKHAEAVKELLGHGADPQQVDQKKNTILHMAVRSISVTERTAAGFNHGFGQTRLMQPVWAVAFQTNHLVSMFPVLVAYVAGVLLVAAITDLSMNSAVGDCRYRHLCISADA
jgi:Ankyrin repeats (many copies)